MQGIGGEGARLTNFGPIDVARVSEKGHFARTGSEVCALLAGEGVRDRAGGDGGSLRSMGR